VKSVGSTLSSGAAKARSGAGSGSLAGRVGGSSGTSGAGGSTGSRVAGILGGGNGPSGAGTGAGPAGTGFTGVGPVASGQLPFGLHRPAGRGPGQLDAFSAALAALEGCFYSLSPFEQQVLVVRTGLDGRTPLTRSQLAAALGMPATAIGRTEQGALAQLEAAAVSDGCMPVGTTSALTPLVDGPFGPIGSIAPALAAASRAAVAGESAPAAFSTSAVGDPLSSLDGHSEAAGPFWSALVIALLLTSALAALGREWRRSVY
jgi:hypothetical protein